MLGLTGLSKVQRFILGIVVLLFVDLLRVVSSELTQYIFNDVSFDKPFFTTYLKTTMFMLYLLGFLLWRPWRRQCRKGALVIPPHKVEDIDSGGESESYLSEPIYVPIKVEKTSGTESEDGSVEDSRSVRFSNLSEVRQCPDKFAEDALIARLSYTASLRAEEARFRSLSKLSVKEVAKLSFIFCILWFFANLAYQEALHDSQAGMVNVLSSTSGFFTLILAAIYPTSNADKFTLSKLVAVLVSIAGVILVSLSDKQFSELDIPVGALWALLGAMLYAFYLVVLRRKVDHEDKIDIPMFFGFVGLFNALLIWPGFLILHYTKTEEFQWPSKQQWLYVCVNGMVGMVVSELLWVWGCFLTTSLVATLGLSLTIPLNMAADVFMKNVAHSWMFYVGSVPIFLSFFAVSFLSHFDGWDPVLLALKKLLHCVCRLVTLPRVHVWELDREQSESLIGVDSTDGSLHTT
ncbi:solute carrier family 35 member F5-like [Liolophura sinensis]|uniref:solute carrier family 35 member F5-like n=1 Tax=Liolophura sinensis TaxID=3198878 RepID=UPI0031580E12